MRYSVTFFRLSRPKMQYPQTFSRNDAVPTNLLSLSSIELPRTPTRFLKFTSLTLLTLSLLYLFNTLAENPNPYLLSSFQTVESPSADSLQQSPPPPPPSNPPPPPPPPPDMYVTGIVDESGAMSEDFEVGEVSDGSSAETERNSAGETEKLESEVDRGRIVERFSVCDGSMREYIPCLDNPAAIRRLNSTARGENYERHCPDDKEGKRLNCLVPRPKGYRSPIHWPKSRDMVWYWPKSRDMVWFNNVPHTRLVEDKGGQNWISVDKDKFVFPGGGTQFIHGANQYLDQISKMVPDISFGKNVRVALDVGCGVASFGAYLMERNVTTLSIAPKDVHENQIQFALERGVPAMVAAFATRRLLYPSQGFDFIHCSRCRVNWTRDDGILLLEVNRILRAGGYFVWAAQPVYKHEENLQKQWREIEDLTERLCWELIKKEGYIAIWRKPLNNNCYLGRDTGVQPPLCDLDDNPDNVWYVDMKPCISRLPESGYGANVTAWPARLHFPPYRLHSIKMDALISQKEIFKAESSYWNEVIESFVRAFHWKKLYLRNVMDMRAGFGGFAAALHDLEINSWVMNVVPTSSFNTLAAIYDRGLIGVMHDWCEAFDTYPRTYDLLHAFGLFSVEQKRGKCSMSTIMLEMDRILRPGGRAYIRDSVSVMPELQDIALAMGWVITLHDTGEGPHSKWKFLRCEKRL